MIRANYFMTHFMTRTLILLVPLLVVVGTLPDAGAYAPDRPAKIGEITGRIKNRLIDTRRDLHRHPELSNREERTGRVVAERLRALGLEVRTGVAGHGVVALLKGGRPGPVVAVRADMDALPVQETIDVPYKSTNAGVKHACGHDAHTSIGLGVAEVLAEMRAELPGTVKFIFQPAEEGPPAGEEGGAKLMTKQGALDDPRPAAIFGLHVSPLIPVGQIGYNAGGTMASADKFIITLRGKKVHGATPHDGIDTVVVASQAVLALQTIHSRRIDTREPMVLSIGIIEGGNRYNIIADTVKLEGTVRTLSEDLRRRVQQMMHETLKGVTGVYGASYEMSYEEGAPVTYNDPKLSDFAAESLSKSLGAPQVSVLRPQMIAEDFGYFAQQVPGFYYHLGVRNEARGITAGLHTPEFDLDEESMSVGVRAMANLVFDFLEKR